MPQALLSLVQGKLPQACQLQLAPMTQHGTGLRLHCCLQTPVSASQRKPGYRQIFPDLVTAPLACSPGTPLTALDEAQIQQVWLHLTCCMAGLPALLSLSDWALQIRNQLQRANKEVRELTDHCEEESRQRKSAEEKVEQIEERCATRCALPHACCTCIRYCPG